MLDSFVYGEINGEDLSTRADNVKNCQEAVKIIKEYETMIKTNEKNIIRFEYEQGKIYEQGFSSHQTLVCLKSMWSLSYTQNKQLWKQKMNQRTYVSRV